MDLLNEWVPISMFDSLDYEYNKIRSDSSMMITRKSL